MLNELWRSERNKIEIIKSYSKLDSPWKADAVLFYVPEGKGTLKSQYGVSSEGIAMDFLVLNDIPLTKWHSESEYWCPTCEKLISAGYGIDRVNEDLIEFIRSKTARQFTNISGSINDFSPLLTLLETGYYVLADLELHPTNGNGDFFWEINNDAKLYKASCTTYYQQEWVSGYPKFLIPTQTPANFDRDRVEYYRAEFKEGHEYRGLAYHVDEYMCALLDGHHKATAAGLERINFKCLTILPVLSYPNIVRRRPSSYWIGGAQLSSDNLPSKMRNFYKRKYQQILKTKEPRNNADIIDKYLDEKDPSWDLQEWPKEIREIGTYYPNVIQLACLQLAGEISDQRIESLLNFSEDDSETKLNFIFNALVAMKDDRAVELGIEIGRRDSLKELWNMVFKYLSSVHTQAVEDFFIDFLVNDDGLRPYLTRIVSNYFSSTN